MTVIEGQAMVSRWMGSPIGGLRLRVSDGLLTRIEFDAKPHGRSVTSSVLDLVEQQLNEYFAGERTRFDLPLTQDGTEFQRKVWAEVQQIEYGTTKTYGEIAQRLRYEPGVSRAVGAANGANPIPIIVPCHRVIGANGTLTGYSGGTERKQYLLQREQPGLF